MGGSSSDVLNATGVDFKNQTQALDFLAEMLDDTVFQVVGNQYARYFWYAIVACIGVASACNLASKATLRMRLKATSTTFLSPARPQNLIQNIQATATAIFREISYPQWTPSRYAYWVKIPPLGTVILLLGYLALILAVEFINNDVPGGQHYTALGVRAGWLAIAQVPLLILLSGKNNLIGLVTGISYERLNVLHRWVARGLLLLATLHFGYQNYGWNQYGIMQLEWSTDTCPPTGIAAYAVLLWINLSTLAPLRQLSYEFFVVQHILSFFGFIIAIMYHLPTTALYTRVYIWIPIGIFLGERLFRYLRWTWHNAPSSKATITQLPGDVTKIRISGKRIRSWTPGSHVLLSIPRFGVLQSHPATIASTPTSHNGDLVFILKSHKGFTKRLARGKVTLLDPEKNIDADTPGQISQKHTAFIDGPYGGKHADFAAFNTVVLIAGSTGVTYILPVLLDIAQRSKSQDLPVREIRILWMVKSRQCLKWAEEELRSASQTLTSNGIALQIDVHVTCDENMTDGTEGRKECGCECDQSAGPCCCVNVDSDTDDDDDNNNNKATTNENKTKNDDISKTDINATATAATTTTEKPIPTQDKHFYTIHSGRPALHPTFHAILAEAEGETGLACCGPLALNAEVRRTVARVSDERAVHKGSGAHGVYGHWEGFCY